MTVPPDERDKKGLGLEDNEESSCVAAGGSSRSLVSDVTNTLDKTMKRP